MRVEPEMKCQWVTEATHASISTGDANFLMTEDTGALQCLMCLLDLKGARDWTLEEEEGEALEVGPVTMRHGSQGTMHLRVQGKQGLMDLHKMFAARILAATHRPEMICGKTLIMAGRLPMTRVRDLMRDPTYMQVLIAAGPGVLIGVSRHMIQHVALLVTVGRSTMLMRWDVTVSRLLVRMQRGAGAGVARGPGQLLARLLTRLLTAIREDTMI